MTRNLPLDLYELLLKYSPAHAERWNALFIRDELHWPSGELPSVEEQIQTMNNFWRHQLGMLNVDTIKVRSFLIDNISPDYWIQNFEKYVLKTVLKHTLPCHINSQYQG
jgi:hypothetical protein